MFGKITTNPQPTCNQGDALTTVSGAPAQKLFTSTIHGTFQGTEGLADDILKLFPLDKIIQFDLEDTVFTVTFDGPTTITLENGAACKLPQTVKGIFDLTKAKLSFPDSKQAPWFQKYLFFTTLSSVEYSPEADTFTLSALKIVSLSRTQFQEIFKGSKLLA